MAVSKGAEVGDVAGMGSGAVGAVFAFGDAAKTAPKNMVWERHIVSAFFAVNPLFLNFLHFPFDSLCTPCDFPRALAAERHAGVPQSGGALTVPGKTPAKIKGIKVN